MFDEKETAMPRKRKSKSSTRKRSKPKRTRAVRKSRTKRGSRATSQAKQTAMKVLAGAAAGAVRAMMPPLEKAAGKQDARSKARKA